MDVIREGMFKACRDIPQCAIAEFTYNGAPVTRQIRVKSTGAVRNYHPTDELKCGPFAYLDAADGVCRCVIFPSVVREKETLTSFPIYFEKQARQNGSASVHSAM